MGLGKTLSSLIYCRTKLAELRYQGVQNPKFMVILPKSAITTWQVECQACTPDIYRDMILMPYSQLNKAPRLIMYYDIRIVVMDESHYLKSPDTNRAEDMATMLRHLDSSAGRFKNGKFVMLSGTPMLNSSAELYTTWAICGSPNCAEAAIRLVDKDRYEKWEKSFSQQKEKRFKKGRGQYRREEKRSVYEGVQNVEMFQELIFPITHYRRSVDCIDLPEHQEIAIDLQIPDDKLLKDADIEKPDNYMAELERLARAKTPHLLQWVKDFLEGNDKQLVVFASYKFPIQELLKRFPTQVVLVTGEETGDERKSNIENFQKGKKRIIALTYRAGAESLNLQNAHISIYLGFPWHDAGIRQAKARTHRSGQKNFSLHYFMYSGHNDMRIRNLVRLKGEATKQVEEHLLAADRKIIREEKSILSLDDFI